MSFQIGCLVSDQGIGGGMAFVEAITGESGDLIENLRRLAAVDAVIGRSTKVARWASISALIFLPIARRSLSAPPRV